MQRKSKRRLVSIFSAFMAIMLLCISVSASEYGYSYEEGLRIANEAYAKEIVKRTKENAENNYDTSYYVELIKQKHNMK